MIGCGIYTGILFSRKPCGQPAAVNCGRCKTPLCKQHLKPQRTGPFLCPSCDAYANDDDWSYSDRGGGWRYRSRDDGIDARPVAAGAAGGAAASDLSDEDKPGLSANASGAWQGPDDSSPGADDDSPDSDMDDGDFDAS